MENLIGFHTSLGPDCIHLFETIKEHKLNTFQVFTKNQRQWKEKIIEPETGKLVRANMKEADIKYAVSHCTYLINLASEDDEIRNKSILAVAAELKRCEELGIAYAVMHPGASKGLKKTEALKKIADGLNFVFENVETTTTLLLENTAGQGSSIGSKFEELRDLLDLIKAPSGICFDTCHAFAAGYPLQESDEIEFTFDTFDEIIGIQNLKVFHMNDSKGNFGSKIDRHEHLGKGKIGSECFEYIVKNFSSLPKIIETNHDDNLHLEDLRFLRNKI